MQNATPGLNEIWSHQHQPRNAEHGLGQTVCRFAKFWMRHSKGKQFNIVQQHPGSSCMCYPQISVHKWSWEGQSCPSSPCDGNRNPGLKTWNWELNWWSNARKRIARQIAYNEGCYGKPAQGDLPHHVLGVTYQVGSNLEPRKEILYCFYQTYMREKKRSGHEDYQSQTLHKQASLPGRSWFSLAQWSKNRCSLEVW